jgi:hypothetical protein
VARPSLAIVVAFFGRAPFWLPAFFLSCRWNPDVRWLLYTDFAVPVEPPPNVSVKPLSLAELGRRASGVLGVTMEPASPRKVNDFKLLYGLVFADDLRPFDFWAYADLDTVWGDVRQFIGDDLLAAHDIVSSRDGRLSGHFTLFRNTEPITRTFELVPDIAQRLADPTYHHLDEHGLTDALKQRLGKFPAPDASPRVYWRQKLTIDSEDQMAMGDTEAESLWWRSGKTFDAAGRERMYLHFHKLKKHMNGIDFDYEDRPEAFAINRAGIRAIGRPHRSDSPE